MKLLLKLFLCECKILNGELSPGPLRSKIPPYFENPSLSSGGLSLLCVTVCICVSMCVNVFQTQMGKGEFERGMKPEKGPQRASDREMGTKPSGGERRGRAFDLSAFWKRRNRITGAGRKEREKANERESEGDGVKRGERWEQIVIPADGGGGGGYSGGTEVAVSAGGGGGSSERERTGKIEGEGRGWERKGESEEFPNERRRFFF